MKLRRFVVLLLVLALMLAGCGGAEVLDDSAVRGHADALMGAFLADDYDACRAIVAPSVADTDLQGIFPAITAELADLGAYEMTAVGWNKKLTGGQDQTTVQYLVSGEGGKYYLFATVIEGVEGLAGFQIAEAEADAEPTEPDGLIHRVVMAFGILILVFVAWMVIDCARRPMKRKWLWMLLIILGAVVLSLSFRDGGVSFRYQLGLYLGLTSLTTYPAGGFMVRLFVPVGAIVYFLKRKQLGVDKENEAE